MKIKEQTRKLACKLYLSNGKATLTWFEFDFRRVSIHYESFAPFLPSGQKAYHTGSKAGYDRFLYFS